MTDAADLLVEEDGSIIIATLNRPEKLNALNAATLNLLETAVHRFRDTPALKVMLIRATGRYFSAGADLREGGPAITLDSGSAIREMHRLKLHGMRRLYDEMEAIEKPFVVAHQGPCVGGGLELSLSCDFRLAARGAHYSFPEGKFGSLPASNGVSRLVRIVGTHWARYLVMGSMIADADKALIMGLVHEVWPNEGFQDQVIGFCRHLALQNAEQMGTAKIAIEMARDMGLAQAGSLERMANSALMLMPSYLDGMARHTAGFGGKSKA